MLFRSCTTTTTKIKFSGSVCRGQGGDKHGVKELQTLGRYRVGKVHQLEEKEELLESLEHEVQTQEVLVLPGPETHSG